MKYLRLLFSAAASGTFLYFVTPAITAEASQLPKLVELWPGMVKILKVDARFQSVLIGNPNVADASAITSNVIAITGKAPGLTNLILIDEKGEEIFDTRIQIVSLEAYYDYDIIQPKERRVVTVTPFNSKGILPDRKYLCAGTCSEMVGPNTTLQYSNSAPPLSAGAASATKSERTISGSTSQQTTTPSPVTPNY